MVGFFYVRLVFTENLDKKRATLRPLFFDGESLHLNKTIDLIQVAGAGITLKRIGNPLQCGLGS